MTASEKLVAALRRGLRGTLGPAGIYFAATVLARAGAIALVPLYTRRLTPEEYGDYALAQTVIVMLPTFLSAGLLSSMARYYYDGKDLAAARIKAAGAARWMALFTLTAALLAQVTILLVVPPHRVGLGGRWELSCMLWAGAGAAFASVPATYLRITQRPLAAAAFQLGQFLSNTGAGIVLVAVLQRRLRGSIEASALAYVVDGTVGLVFLLVVLKGPMTRAVLREALRFSLPFVPHFAANQLQQISDRWTLKFDGQQAQLGGYALAGQVIAPTFMAVIAWNDADTPRMGERFREGGLPLIRRHIGTTRRNYLLAAAVPGILATLALPLIAVVVGGRFTAALTLVPWMAASMLVETLYFPYANVVFFANRTSVVPKITIAAGLLNVGLNIVLIRRFGVGGAIVSRALSMGFRSAAMWWAAHRCFVEAEPRG